MKKHYKISLLLFFILLGVLQDIVAQDTISVGANQERADTIIIKSQPRAVRRTTTVVDATSNEPVQVDVSSVVKRQGDPMRATMYSAVFPGGGQILNRKYWKLPIVYAGFGAVAYMFKFNSDNYKKFYRGYVDFTDDIRETNSYQDFILGDPVDYDPVLHPDTYKASTAKEYEERMLRLLDYHKRNRDLSIILAGVWYLVQILDANVDASLMGYDVSDNLDLTVVPTMLNIPGFAPTAGINLSFTMSF